ncbi:MAG: hypothetical protein IBJ02_03025 [Brevundimonas sp.]|nr:hypothetical protein [Brevundimonas sp.]
MTVFEEQLRKRLPLNIDLDALQAKISTEVGERWTVWRRTHPGEGVAVVEVRIQASGAIRRRLRRYRETSEFHGPPGILVSRRPSSGDKHLVHWLTQVATCVSRAGGAGYDWRMMTATEALQATP